MYVHGVLLIYCTLNVSLDLFFCVKGIVRALKEFKHLLIEYNISIFVRRGGPNYQEGLRVMRDVGGFGDQCPGGHIHFGV